LQVPSGGQNALISVADHGIGIPQAEQTQVFGQFVRASNAESHGISGTGLGLYLCRELISLHGGEIWFESTEGVGSTFFLRLPLSQNTPTPDSSSSMCEAFGDRRSGVNPYYQTTPKVNIVHLESKPFQIL
jgi:signal transduction histidine kinase